MAYLLPLKIAHFHQRNLTKTGVDCSYFFYCVKYKHHKATILVNKYTLLGYFIGFLLFFYGCPRFFVNNNEHYT